MSFLSKSLGKFQNLFARLHLKKKHCVVASSAIVLHAQVEGYSLIGKRSNIKNTALGIGSYVGSNSQIPNSLIGRYCSIGNNIQIITGRHPTKDFVSSNPIFYDTYNKMPLGKSQNHFEEFNRLDGKYSVKIGNDVWIGANVLLREGITVGDGAVIAMGSVVVKDVLPYEIVGGNPAKNIRYRFSAEQIQQLLKLQWWNWPVEKVKEEREKFANIDTFLSTYKADSK
jgi:acetyltransferase-like isoleucine patch superfamily enzyme